MTALSNRNELAHISAPAAMRMRRNGRLMRGVGECSGSSLSAGSRGAARETTGCGAAILNDTPDVEPKAVAVVFCLSGALCGRGLGSAVGGPGRAAIRRGVAGDAWARQGFHRPIFQ